MRPSFRRAARRPGRHLSLMMGTALGRDNHPGAARIPPFEWRKRQ
ncbi:hypothetical protein [Cystobacter fuscus]